MKLNDIYMRDPFIFVEDDICYLIGTTDKQAWGGKASSFLGYKSKDLINFEGPYTLFINTDDFWADENFWAPELHKINGKYYIFASFYKQGLHRASQVLECDTVFGTYKPSKKPFTPADWECLDATHFEENGKHYSVFCHEWAQIHDGEICVGELNNDFTELKNIKVLFHASDAPWVVNHTPGSDIPNYVTDGPFIYKTKDNILLMIWSSFSKGGYALGIAKSCNGILGPWTQIEKPLYKNGGGHGMIFSFKGKLYLTIHINNDEHLKERPIVIEIYEENNMLYLK